MYRGRNDRSYRGGQRSNFDNRKNTPQRPQMKKEIGSSPSPSTISPATAQARPAAAQARPAAAQAQARPNQAREPERAEQVSPAVKPIVKDPPKESRSYPDTKTDQNKSAERSSSSMSSGDRDRRHHQSRDHNERSRDGSRNRDGSGHAGRDEGREQQSHSQDEEQMSTEVSSGRKPEKKFTQRCRLFVGNLTPETTEEDFKILFDKYGEISEVFLNKSKGFGFIRLDTRYNAEAAKAELDGTMRKGRMLRVRFATHGAALKVKNIPTCVSNELLEQAFSQFGVVERAVVIVDDRGRPTSEGIVEFARKPGAQNALTRIKEGVFLLTSTPNPISVEPLEQRDEEDGLPEKNIPKNQAYHQERENAPRFGAPGSFEFTWGNRWKALEEAEKMQRDRLEKQIQDNREKLEGEIEMAKHEHQAMLMRQELMRRQDELNRHEENLLRAQEQRRQKDEQRRREEALMKQQQEELLRRRQQQQQQQQQGGAMSLGQQDMRRQQQSEDVRHANLRGVGNGGQQPRIQLMQNLAEHQGNGTKTQIPQGMQMRGAGGHQGPMNQTSAMAGQANQGLLANPSMQALVQGLGGGNANVGRMGQGQAQTIQSKLLLGHRMFIPRSLVPCPA